MSNSLDKVFEVAKKLRKFVKKGSSPEMQSLVTDLNLLLADVKVELVEQRLGQVGGSVVVTQDNDVVTATETVVAEQYDGEHEVVGAGGAPQRRGPEDDFNYTLS